jgi:hypothetical protein
MTSSGRDWWLSMSALRTGDRTYTGDLIQTTGPPFSAQPFDPGRSARTPVGTGTLAFADTDSATFTYRVNGVQQIKSLVRFSFGPAPACVQMPMPDYAAAANYQGLWWIAAGAESGWGINFAHQGDVIFASWFTYDVDGAPLWLYVTALRQDASNVYRGDILRTSGARFDHFDSDVGASAAGGCSDDHDRPMAPTRRSRTRSPTPCSAARSRRRRRLRA